MWKSVSALMIAMENDDWKLARDEFWAALAATRRLIADEAIFIPTPIAMASETLVNVVRLKYQVLRSIEDGPEADKQRIEMAQTMYTDFRNRRTHLEQLIRRYFNGEDLKTIEAVFGEATVQSGTG
jgi:hypothetical protein